MINQLSKTKAWAEFVEWWQRRGYGWWIDDNGTFYSDTNRTASNLELLSLLVEFCDSKEYYIDIMHDDYYAEVDGSAKFHVSVKDEHCSDWGEPFYSTRTEATQQAVVKCFELMVS